MTDNRPTGGNVDITGNPEERLKETFTSPYPVDDTETEWHALIVALANQFEEITATKDAVLQSRFIDDATGEQLDKVGSIFQLERRTGESDSTYRLRLKVELRAALTAGTYEDVLDVISLLIDADTTDINIREYQQNEPTVKVLIPVANFSALEVTGSTFEELIERVTAAGVNGSVSLITPPSGITIQTQPILVATMSELPETDVEVSGTNTEDELLYAGLSSDTLNPLSGDNYRGIEVTATLLANATSTISTESVRQRTIGSTESLISAVSKPVSHTIESEYALSSAQLETLSAAEWQDGTPTQSRFETELSVGSVSLVSESTTSETIGPTTATVSLTTDATSSQNLYAALSSDQLEPLSQGGRVL